MVGPYGTAQLLEVSTVRKTQKYSKLEFFLLFHVGETS
jgi:hypothetical protein